MATTHVYFVRISAAAIGTTLAKIAIGTAIGVAVKCFIAGTLVLTAAGLKKIEDIKEGDLVLAYDEETGEQAYKPVVRLFRNESKDWTGVTVNGTEIVSTPGHKYYLPETKTWVSAEDLKVGIKVLLSDGSYGIIEAVKPIHYDEPQTTYNFEVEDFHTYYVGNGVLVHNRNCRGKQKKLEEISQDDKISKTIRNEIIQDHKKTGKYHVPEGYELRHKIGFESNLGYDYSFTELQLKSLHKTETKLQWKLGLLKNKK